MHGKLLAAVFTAVLVTSGLAQPVHVNAATAYIETDKEEISLGEDLTIRLAEPDANIDSRSIDRISLSKLFITTNKFDETPLDEVLARTGIRPSQSFLRETGFNTGVFEVTLQSINSRLVDRGSQIRIIYFDETPSGGGSPVRVQTVVQVVESTIAVMFDKKEYSLFDEIEIRLIAPMFNVNRNKIDTLNTPTGSRVAVTTASGQTFYPPMFETDVNTGVFVGKVRLTPDQHEKEGDLIVTSGDRIVVSVVIVPGFAVSAEATVAATLGSISFGRSEYSIGDTVEVAVIDPDENRDSSIFDTVRVRAWSNTDIEGIQLVLHETGPATGIFTGSFSLSQESSTDNSIMVSEDDVLVALYSDRTVPLTNVTHRDLFATATIGPIRPSIVVSNPTVMDENDMGVDTIEAGTKVTLQSSITNAKDMEEAFVYIIHVRDSDGFTSQIYFVRGTLDPYQSISVGRHWTPVNEGTYTIEVFTWDSLVDPVVLSPVKRTLVIVR